MPTNPIRESSRHEPSWHELAQSRKQRGPRIGLRAWLLLVFTLVAFGVMTGLSAGLARSYDASARFTNDSTTARRRFEQQAALLLGAGGSVIALAAVFLSGVYVRRTLGRLGTVTAALRQLPAGETPVIDSSGHGPLAELATACNDLLAWSQTHERQIDEARKASALAITELETKLASHTAQLENANERLSGEIAEKEDFLRAVSHDLNAPLRNIGGMVSMLLLKNKDHLPDDALKRLERIQKNVEVETDLINELLELSRIKTRRQSLSLVDTERIVWELRGIFENDLKTRHIDLIIETSLPALYAERARIRQIFQNLIDNAIKYMGDFPTREIRVGCQVSVTEADFYVRDTGTGIHPDDLDKVFCVFRRGRGEAAQKVAGKGVGLASVKSIVQTYAGRVTVQSRLGEGTTFRFTINGKFVPAVSGQVPTELDGPATQLSPTLAPAATPQAA